MRCALVIAGIIFAIVSLIQLSRLIYQFPLVVGTTAVPLWASGVAFAVAGILALWMFSAACCKSSCKR